MRVAVAYTTVANSGTALGYLTRFVATRHSYPAGIEHDIIAISNGGKPSTEVLSALACMNAAVFERSNDGWDIGGYLEAARGPLKQYDVVLCAGESVYFHRAGWLRRLVDEWDRHGPGIYGPFATYVFRPHLPTSAFLTSPTLLASYPLEVKTKAERYEFEHGVNAFWKRLVLRGLQARLVTWDGCWTEKEWRFPPNVLFSGNQSNVLMWCNHIDNFSRMNPSMKALWKKYADAKR